MLDDLEKAYKCSLHNDLNVGSHDQWISTIRDRLDQMDLPNRTPDEALVMGAWLMNGAIFIKPTGIPEKIGRRALYMMRALCDRLDK